MFSFMKKISGENMMNDKVFDLFFVTDNIDDMFDYLENY